MSKKDQTTATPDSSLKATSVTESVRKTEQAAETLRPSIATEPVPATTQPPIAIVQPSNLRAESVTGSRFERVASVETVQPVTQPQPLAATVQPSTVPDPTDPTESESQPINYPGIHIPSDANDKIITVMIQTGASISGAKKMFEKMNDEEKCLLCESLSETNGVISIRNSAKYFAAFESYNDRVYKASVESAPTDFSQSPKQLPDS